MKTQLSDGSVVPSNCFVLVDAVEAHMNPNIYPDPEVFDPFRFSKLRAQEGDENNHLFTRIGKDVCTLRNSVSSGLLTIGPRYNSSFFYSGVVDMPGELTKYLGEPELSSQCSSYLAAPGVISFR